MKGEIIISKHEDFVELVPRLWHMEQFVNNLKLEPMQEKEGLFIKEFKLSKDELDSMLFFGMFNINTNVEFLEKQLQKMRHLQFDSFIQSELDRLQEKYPSGKPIKFELFVLDENDDFVKDKLGGVSAFTDWDGKMCFVVYPDEKVRFTLKSVIAHEYHHHWRMSRLRMNEEGETLLDRLVLEGLAEHFVRIELGESYLGPMMDALSEKEARSLWKKKYRAHLYDKGSSTDFYLFGDDDLGIPFWAGYSLGYYLVKWFIERYSSISIEELTLYPSEKYIVD